MEKVKILEITCCNNEMDYSPVLIITEFNDLIDVIYTGDNIHTPGYDEFLAGYIKSFNDFIEYLPDYDLAKVDINNDQSLKKYESYIRLSGMYDEFSYYVSHY